MKALELVEITEVGPHQEKRSRKLLEKLVHTNRKDINKTWNGMGVGEELAAGPL